MTASDCCLFLEAMYNTVPEAHAALAAVEDYLLYGSPHNVNYPERAYIAPAGGGWSILMGFWQISHDAEMIFYGRLASDTY